MPDEKPKTKAVFWSCPNRQDNAQHLVTWVNGVAHCSCGLAGPPALFPLRPIA